MVVSVVSVSDDGVLFSGPFGTLLAEQVPHPRPMASWSWVDADTLEPLDLDLQATLDEAWVSADLV